MEHSHLRKSSSTITIRMGGATHNVQSTGQQLRQAGYLNITVWHKSQSLPDGPAENIILPTNNRLRRG